MTPNHSVSRRNAGDDWRWRRGRADGHAVECGGRQAGGVATAHSQTDVDVLSHGDRLVGAKLCPVDAIQGGISTEGATAAHQLHPVRQTESCRADLAGGSSRAGAVTGIHLRVEVRLEDAHGVSVEGIADHDSAGRGWAYGQHPGYDGAVAGERLIHKVNSVGGAPSRGTRSTNGERSVGVVTAPREPDGTYIQIRPNGGGVRLG